MIQAGFIRLSDNFIVEKMRDHFEMMKRTSRNIGEREIFSMGHSDSK